MAIRCRGRHRVLSSTQTEKRVQCHTTCECKQYTDKVNNKKSVSMRVSICLCICICIDIYYMSACQSIFSSFILYRVFYFNFLILSSSSSLRSFFFFFFLLHIYCSFLRKFFFSLSLFA